MLSSLNMKSDQGAETTIAGTRGCHTWSTNPRPKIQCFRRVSDSGSYQSIDRVYRQVGRHTNLTRRESDSFIIIRLLSWGMLIEIVAACDRSSTRGNPSPLHDRDTTRVSRRVKPVKPNRRGGNSGGNVQIRRGAAKLRWMTVSCRRSCIINF